MSAPAVRLMIRELDGRTAPAAVWRRGDRTIVAWEPRAYRIDIVEWLVDNLRDHEQDLLVEGLGLTWPLPDWTTRKRPAFLYVPPALRLPGQGALQGGAEYFRRQALGQLDIERASFRAERLGLPDLDLQAVDDLARL